MQSLLHPLAKTSVQARQTLKRLEAFKTQFPNDEFVQNGMVDRLINEFQGIRKAIPHELRDLDIRDK